MFRLKLKTKKNETNQTNETKKNRMKIKEICLPSNKLFQVPFKKEQIDRYKGISNCNTYDCFFQVMTVLGLRHYSVSRKDSLKVKKKNSYGVETRDAAKYLSTIFHANIETKLIITSKVIEKYNIYKNIYIPRTPEPIHKQLFSLLDLENGYATFICGLSGTHHISGHFFIIYKENNIIYYYDQTGKSLTKDVYDIIDKKDFVGFFVYYNKSKESCLLMKDKITIDIPID